MQFITNFYNDRINFHGSFLRAIVSNHADRTMVSPTKVFKPVAISNDKRIAVSVSMDNSLIAWRLDPDTTQEKIIELSCFNSHNRPIDAIAISDNGSRAAAVSYDAVGFWDLNFMSKVDIIQPHTERAHLLAMSSDGTKLISGGYDNQLCVWTWGKGNTKAAISWVTLATDTIVSAIAISDNGKTGLAACLDSSGSPFVGTILVSWDLELPVKKKLTAKLPYYSVSQLAIANNRIILGTKRGKLVMLDLETFELIFKFPDFEEKITQLKVSPDKKSLIVVCEDKTVRLWNLEDKPREISCERLHPTWPTEFIEIIPDW